MIVSSSLSHPKHSILWYRRIIEQGVRAGGTGPEGFQTEGYGYPAGYPVYGFDELLSKLYTIPTPSANFVSDCHQWRIHFIHRCRKAIP